MRSLFSASLMCAGLVLAAGARAQPRPAVVELFTSEGCSSCPPAEAYLGELAQRPDVIALSFHVDYWDDLGWRDRFGIPEATPRQRGYARALRLPTVYTPQVVIDGRGDFVGSDRAKIGKALAAARSGVALTLGVRDGAVSVRVDAQPGAVRSDVLLVAYRRSAISPIGRGENSGRTLTEYNIVRGVRSIGQYVGQAGEYRIERESLPSDATDVAIVLQSVGQGPILGAAAFALPDTSTRASR